MDISLSDKIRRDRLAPSSDRITSQYASKPRSAKAQARGDEKSSTDRSESLNKAEAQRRRDGLKSEREHSPSAQTVRPWLSSEPTSSSQRLSKLKKVLKRFASLFQACWMKDAKRLVSVSLSASSPGAAERRSHKQRARVVVHAIAMASVRHAIHGMLEKAGIVAHRQKVLGPQVGGGEFSALRSATFGQLQNRELAVAPGVLERRDITLRRAGPGHRPAGGKGALPHGVTLFIIRQELSNLRSHGLRVGEGHKNPAAIRQKFGCMPIRSRDHSLAEAETVGQRARGHLRGVHVGGDVDVAH